MNNVAIRYRTYFLFIKLDTVVLEHIFLIYHVQICTVFAFISAIELPRIPAYLPKKIDNCKFVSQCHAIIRKKCLGCFMTTFLPSFCYYLSVFLTTEYHLLIEVHESLNRIFPVFMRVSGDTEISLPHFSYLIFIKCPISLPFHPVNIL